MYICNVIQNQLNSKLTNCFLIFTVFVMRIIFLNKFPYTFIIVLLIQAFLIQEKFFFIIKKIF